MLADLDLHAAGEHDVKLLPQVRGQVNGLVLCFLGILIANPVGLGLLVSELRCQVRDRDPFLPGGGFPLAATGDRIGGQESVMAFQQFRQLHVEGLGGLIDESERHIRTAGFIPFVFLDGYFSLLRHILGCPAKDLPHLTQAGSDRTELVQVGLGIHGSSPPQRSVEIK